MYVLSSNQRAAYHARDMNHAHCMEEKLRPEMSEKPSALWQKRQVRYLQLFSKNCDKEPLILYECQL